MMERERERERERESEKEREREKNEDLKIYSIFWFLYIKYSVLFAITSGM